MKKIIFLMLLLTSCSYKPVIDTAGRSGTFDISKSDEITNDLQHCKTLAKDNTNGFVESSKYVWNYYFDLVLYGLVLKLSMTILNYTEIV